jgi:SanA protein
MNKLKTLFLTILIFSSLAFANDNNYKIYTNIKDIPAKKAALVLGTSKYISKGKENNYYTYRIKAAAQLWKAKKIKAIVVSGDKSKYYDEVTTMFKDLIKAGVPARYITRDFGGFRTFDSIVRAKEIFDLDDYIIVSQNFHLDRALYIAKEKNQRAIGFAAKEVKGTQSYQRMEERETLAMLKAYLDINFLDTKPKVLGKKIKVNYAK